MNLDVSQKISSMRSGYGEVNFSEKPLLDSSCPGCWEHEDFDISAVLVAITSFFFASSLKIRDVQKNK